MEFGFRSIPVEKLPSLIEDIKTDYNRWITEPNDSDVKPLAEKPSAWTGLSGDVQTFFKARNIIPYRKYNAHYSDKRHTIATSYVWSRTTLLDLTGEYAKPEYKGRRVFIDVLVVPQQDVESQVVIGTTSEAYSDVWVVAFVAGGYLRRAWCCAELAVATKNHCKITVVGTCDQVVGRDFYDKMEAKFQQDIKLIKAEIIKEHGTAKDFNDTVASAMEVLFVAAAKNKLCELFNGPRHQRREWTAGVQPTNPQEQPRDQQLDWEVLVGNMSHASASLNRSLTVCLVSTLTDTMLEWSFFIQDCVPYLEKCALKRGLDLVISDMRRGCRDEDSVAPEITLAELQRCKAESAAVCFLVISGDKYGHRPIPTRIPKADFDNLVTKMRADDADRVKGYYLLDENQLNQDKCPAPAYVLQADDMSSKAVNRYAFLSSTFRTAAKQLWPHEELRNPKSKHPIKSFFTSQVEMELFQGIFCEPIEAQDVHVYLRSFQPGSLNFDTSPVIGIYKNKQDDHEGIQLLRDLQGTMIPGVIKPECITRYEIAFQEGIDPDGAKARSVRNSQLPDSDAPSQFVVPADDHRSYLCEFLDHSCNVVLRSLDKLEQRLAVKPSPLVDEIRLHLDFAQVRGQRFCNTPSSSAAVVKVRSYLSGKGGRTFVLWAPSGAGKTYVLAKAAAEGESGDAPRGTVVMRFLGTSSKSSDALSLLQSVCEQLQAISVGKKFFTEGQHEQSSGLDPCPTSYEELCKYFKTALERWSWGPLSIFLDSVDQLDDTNSGRNLAWLPLEGYSDQVHMVVSTLPDEIKPDVGRPFRCLSTLRKGLKEENFVQVETLQDAQILLRHLLRLKGRCATPDQISLIVDALGNAENKAQTPLMATLLAHLASGWNSFTNTPNSLPSSVRGIIFEFFQILERKHGETLVRHVLCLITLAKQGLSVSELQELLSLDDDALAASFEWWVTPQLKMPSAPLLLLLTDLAPFLSKRGVVIFWYHRQLWEAVEAIYLKKLEARAAFHRILAEFFCGRWSGDKKKSFNENLRIRLGTNHASNEIAVERGGCRHVRDQPYHLKGASALHPGAEYNNRRCVEALHQMVKELEVRTQDTEKSVHMRWSDELSECLEMAAEELCSVDGVCARSMVGEEFNLVSQCAKVAELSSLEGSRLNALIIKHYHRWIRRDTHEFKSQGQVVASLLRQPDTSEVRRHYLESKPSIPGIPAAVFGNSSDFDAVISILKGHTGSVHSVSCEGDQIASASGDKTIIIWDAKTGDQVSMLKGHTGEVMSVAWRPGGDQIASALYDGTVIIWDAKTGEQVSTLKGHTAKVTCVAWRPGSPGRPGGDQIASGSYDGTVIIWDAKTGEQISTLKGHTNWVTSVAWRPGSAGHPGGDQIASGSVDNTIIIWDAKTGEHVSTLKGHTSAVTSVAWRPGGDQIASGSADETIIIWDAKTGEQISTLKGHTHQVTSVAWRPGSPGHPGGDQIVSGGYGAGGNPWESGEIIIWDATTGEQIFTLKGHTQAVTSVAWRPGGDQIASASHDGTVIIWDAKTGEQVSTLKGHTAEVLCVAWRPGSPGRPGGDQIASGSWDNTVIIWDAKTGEQISTLKGHTNWVTSVAWRPGSPGHPGGDQIASGSLDKTIIIWDAKTGEQISTLKGHTNFVTSVDWRPGGDQIASGSADNTIIIWDATTGEQVSTLKGHTSWVTSVAWRPERPGHPGGDQIASASYDKTIIIWDAKTGEQISTLKGHTREVTSVAWRPGSPGHPGGDQIASASNDRTIIIWDAKTGEQISTLKGHTGGVTSVAWRPGSPGHPGGDQIASGSSDCTIIIWDATTGKQISTLEGHEDEVSSVAWRPERPGHPGGDQIASASWDKTVIIWDAKTGEQISTLKGHTDRVTSVAWRPGSPGHPGGDQIASGSMDNTVIIWDAKTGEQISTLKGHTGWVQSVAWRPGSPGHPGGDQIASGSGDGTVIIWDAKTGEQISTLKGHTREVTSVAWRPGSPGHPGGDQIASCSYDKTIIIWDAKTGEQVSMLNGHTSAVRSVSWHPEGEQIASSSEDKTIIIWDAKTGEQISTLNGHTDEVRCVSWSPNGDQIASASDDKTIIIWDAKTGQQISTLRGHTNYVMSLAWRPGGNQIASGSFDKTIIIWDAKTGNKVSTLEGHSDYVRSISWNSSGSQIASGSHDKTVIIWDAKTGNQMSALKGHSGDVYSVGWSSTGDRIASGSADKTIMIWDAKSGDLVSTLKGHTEAVFGVAWSPSGQQVASASGDKTITVWDAGNGAILSQLKGHSDVVLSVAWSTSGEQVVSGSRDKTVIVWDAKTGEERLKLEGHASAITSVACSVKGQVASGSSDGTVIVWDGQSGERKTTLGEHPGSVQGVAWSPSGDKIVTACSDESLFVWDAESGKQISTLQGQVGDVISVARSLSSTKVISDVQDVKSGAVYRAPGDDLAHGVAGQGNQAAMISEDITIRADTNHQLRGSVPAVEVGVVAEVVAVAAAAAGMQGQLAARHHLFTPSRQYAGRHDGPPPPGMYPRPFVWAPPAGPPGFGSGGGGLGMMMYVPSPGPAARLVVMQPPLPGYYPGPGGGLPAGGPVGGGGGMYYSGPGWGPPAPGAPPPLGWFYGPPPGYFSGPGGGGPPGPVGGGGGMYYAGQGSYLPAHGAPPPLGWIYGAPSPPGQQQPFGWNPPGRYPYRQ